ncbi:glutamyl-tRNA(Gln) amidotransferase subunit C [Iodidimonas nitroreducens]|uniref:Aspartyl/glutamyl-tRNA(Asn/Gln) amidotransferase subunit C n=1 Tax=Iodidimonas nitroreducens TaxID=1236968 RepID=A0A5A7NCF3_9PROT|nr:Asp-tRNA(Asn)/Glu-tRNA(Gln) amidotransferase subunit GatC [Iodidimonas nitroreducens]GAK34157.1 aspartyl/glutamyl-tRNA(Asn/Gln) amidotransferase subunit C [alpha proteobacterium Q-1]GER05150.1 glutamyl-tRNA(Gln) amidotransferase subunit C [Iodidimonas nitroreducens]
MSVDKATVERIAKLARIRIEDHRLAPLAGELNQILGWVEQLSAVDTDQVKPMTSVVDHALYWRDDVIADGSKRDEILANAPAAEFGFFAVPKVIE